MVIEIENFRDKRRRNKPKKRKNKRIAHANRNNAGNVAIEERSNMQTNYGNTVLASGKLETKRYDKSKLRGHIDKKYLCDYVKPRYGVIIKKRFEKTVFDLCQEKRKIA